MEQDKTSLPQEHASPMASNGPFRSKVELLTATLILLSVGVGVGSVRSISNGLSKRIQAVETALGSVAERLAQVGHLGRLPDLHSDNPEEILNLVQQAQDAGDTDKALLYCLNGLNHFPGQMALIRRIADLALSEKSTTPERREQIQSVLDLSAYQVKSTDLEEVLTLKEKLNKVQLASAQLLDDSPPQSSWEERYRTALSRDLGSVAKEGGVALAAHIEDLEAILADAHDSEKPPQETIDKLVAAIDNGRITLTALTVLTSLDQAQENLERAVESDEQRTVSIIQAMEGWLGQAWGLNLSKLPPVVAERIGQYPGKIRAQIDRMEEKKDAPRLAEIERVCLHTYSETSQQGRAKQIEGDLKETGKLYQQLLRFESRAKADKHIASLSERLTKTRQDQYDAYQKWTLQRINSAFAQYRSITVVYEKDANNIFTEHNLAEIDITLLKADVASVANDVMSKLMAELGVDKKFQTYKTIAEAKKRRLEDF